MMHRRLQPKRVSTASGFWSKGSDQLLREDTGMDWVDWVPLYLLKAKTS